MQDRERVLSALSHDMKNLVGAVDMNLQLIPLVLQSGSSLHAGTDGSNPPVGEFLDRAHQAAIGIGSLVDDVVTWFRLDKDASAVRNMDPEAEMNLGRMVALVRAEFSAAIKMQGLVFHLEMDGDSSAVVAGQGAPWRVLRLLMQHCLRFLFPDQILNMKLSSLPGGAFEFSLSTDQEAVFDGQARSLAWLLAQDFTSSSGGIIGLSTELGAGSTTGEKVTIRWV